MCQRDTYTMNIAVTAAAVNMETE